MQPIKKIQQPWKEYMHFVLLDNKSFYQCPFATIYGGPCWPDNRMQG